MEKLVLFYNLLSTLLNLLTFFFASIFAKKLKSNTDKITKASMFSLHLLVVYSFFYHIYGYFLSLWIWDFELNPGPKHIFIQFFSVSQ